MCCRGRGDTRWPGRLARCCIAALEFHTGRIEIIPPIFVVSFTLFSPLNINGHMLSGVMAQEVTTAYNTRLLTLFYCLQISSIVFSYTSILSRFPLCPPPLPPSSTTTSSSSPSFSSLSLPRRSSFTLSILLSRRSSLFLFVLDLLLLGLRCVVVVLLSSMHTRPP